MGYVGAHIIIRAAGHRVRSARNSRKLGEARHSLKERDVIQAFVEHMRKHGHAELRVDRWPDEENRESPDIDATAGPFRIEHTSIDTIRNQRRDSDWFMQVVGGIDDELSTALPFSLRIILEYGAVSKGQNWGAIREAIKNWVLREVNDLPDGYHPSVDLPGVPFRLRVRKSKDQLPGLSFARAVPEDDSLSQRVRTQFERKAAKLSKYHKPCTTTVLLVETDDIALMSELTLLGAIREAFSDGLPSGVAQIWYVDTSIPSELIFRNLTPEVAG